MFNLNTCNTRGVAQQESGLWLRGATMTTHHARKRRPVTQAELQFRQTEPHAYNETPVETVLAAFTINLTNGTVVPSQD